MWINECVFYEIYVPSFSDGNGDGIGDLAGIIDKLSYLKELGIKGIWLTPFYKSPKVDNGYDISDYYQIDPCYGTMDQFVTLVNKAKELNIRVVIDLVLNHTSTEHHWFAESRRDINNSYRDYYIWRKQIPNNWESFFGGSAWEYCPLTEEYYYHAFSKEQACLNWSNESVKGDMKKVMKFWLEKGVDGFRLDVINFLKLDMSILDSNNPYDDNNEQIHKFDQNQQGILTVIEDLNDFVKGYGDKVLIGEVGSEQLSILNQYIGSDKLDLVFNFNLGSISEFNVNTIYNQLVEMNGYGILPTLFFGSHDMGRWFSRLAKENMKLSEVIASLMLLGYGVPFIYQGDEMPMLDFYAKNIDEIKDIQAKLTYGASIKKGDSEELALSKANLVSRDKSRQCIDWTQGYQGPLSSFYRRIIKLRNENQIFQYGEYSSMKLINSVIILNRIYQGKEICIFLNFTAESTIYDKEKGELLFANTKVVNNKICPFEVSVYYV